MNISKCYLSFLLIVLSSFGLNATNYYVSNSGADSDTGLSLGNAFLTLQHAADLVIAGDTVFVEDGTYVGFDLRNVNGTAASPIIFIGLGDNVLINQSGPIRNDGINIENADYVIIDNFIVNDMPGNGNGIRVVVSNNCTVRNCACDNNAERGIFTGFTDDILIEYNVCTNSIDEHGIYVSNSSDRPIIRFNECYGNNNTGIHLNGDASAGGDGIISDALIYGNLIHDNNRSAGINMDGLQNPTIYNNLIYNNHSAQGIALFQQDGAIATNGAKIYNNTIIVPSDGRWGILVQNGANINTEIYNNIIINQHAWRGCIALNDTAMFTSDNNILNDKMSDNGDGSAISLAAWQALGLDTNSLLADPINSIFVNPSSNNFNLLADSQAIDAGTNLVSTIVTDDINGASRPMGVGYDIGAFELGTTLSINNDALLAEAILVYPNPTNGILHTDIKNLDRITVYDITGRYIKTITPESTIDLSELSPGTYLLKILSKGRTLTTKVVKK
ncbi:right-handed parallel beta-helix repeat-containing protein [Psychroserpens sp. NJDZ02]|uniref:right-handed parallel beta-helix repeat-containing protein n=1 Tax=Psychroserpens sp. NJDZ02 TaxID=2570561 RepID=UPI0010A7AD7A|nr:right-handed parallel beta-helix repeat-containing protein [Psychroserpens sp. NJDZ02]QCE40903.1 T9SS type A sorting domain-containing protein [Psychroserpens sp. NJDZ02]